MNTEEAAVARADLDRQSEEIGSAIDVFGRALEEEVRQRKEGEARLARQLAKLRSTVIGLSIFVGGCLLGLLALGAYWSIRLLK